MLNIASPPAVRLCSLLFVAVPMLPVCLSRISCLSPVSSNFGVGQLLWNGMGRRGLKEHYRLLLTGPGLGCKDFSLSLCLWKGTKEIPQRKIFILEEGKFYRSLWTFLSTKMSQGKPRVIKQLDLTTGPCWLICCSFGSFFPPTHTTKLITVCLQFTF